MSRGARPAPRPRRRAAAPSAAPVRGALRIVAGSHRGRRLDVPGGSATRPTSDRVREALFNALDSLDAVVGVTVVDAFAGSGALGIEALSRGATHATFVDDDPGALAVVRGNLDALNLAARARVVPGPASRALAVGGPWDLVLLDPPYAFEPWAALLDDVVATLAPDGIVVIESDHEVALPPGLRGVRSRTYGGTVVQFARPAGAST